MIGQILFVICRNIGVIDDTDRLLQIDEAGHFGLLKGSNDL